MTGITLTAIGEEISKHLRRFERDPEINVEVGKSGTHRYWLAGAGRSGNRVWVRYVNYQGAQYLTRAQAWAYLTWLQAGNVGKHWDQQREERENAGS